jgi:hypothetical protein
MAQHTEHEKHAQSSSSDPRQHNETSTGRGESGSAREEESRGTAQASTSSGRSSNESDSRAHATGAEQKEGGLTMGTNGGEKIGGAKPGRKESQSSHEHSGNQKKHKAS